MNDIEKYRAAAHSSDILILSGVVAGALALGYALFNGLAPDVAQQTGNNVQNIINTVATLRAPDPLHH
jgi:hypothetical protein